MATHTNRHTRLTRIGDLLDDLADLVIEAASILIAFVIGALFAAALFAAALHRLGVWQ